MSDGNSLLLNGPGTIPAWWDDATPLPAYSYIRQTENELFYVRPPTNSGPLGHDACVTRAFRLPSD